MPVASMKAVVILVDEHLKFAPNTVLTLLKNREPPSCPTQSYKPQRLTCAVQLESTVQSSGQFLSSWPLVAES